MEGLKIQLPSEVTDTTLPKLGEYRIPIVMSGNGVSTSRLSITTNKSVVYTLTNGYFTNSSGTVNNGTTMQGGSSNFYVRMTQDGYLTISEKSAVTRLGGYDAAVPACEMNDPLNAPLAIFDLEDMPTGLVEFYNTHGILRGNISNFKRMTKLVSFIQRKDENNISDAQLAANKNFDLEYISGVMPENDFAFLPATLTRFWLMTRGNMRLRTDGFYTAALTQIRINIRKWGSRTNDVQLTGDIWQFRSTILTWLEYQGDVLDSMDGSLSVTASNITGLTRLYLPKNNLLTGKLSDIPGKFEYIDVRSNGKLSGWTNKAWTGTKSLFNYAGATQTSAVIDAILNDIAPIPWSAGGSISLAGSRSSASDEALTVFRQKGCNVYLNGTLIN